MLLHFALGYWAFYLEHNNIPTSAYYEFVGQLIANTLVLRPPELAGCALEAAVEWVMGNLPAVSSLMFCTKMLRSHGLPSHHRMSLMTPASRSHPLLHTGRSLILTCRLIVL